MQFQRAGERATAPAREDQYRLPLEKTNIVVDAFPVIDSAGLYIAQPQGLFAAQGLHVTIVPVTTPPPSTQDLINGQEQGKYGVAAHVEMANHLLSRAPQIAILC